MHLPFLVAMELGGKVNHASSKRPGTITFSFKSARTLTVISVKKILIINYSCCVPLIMCVSRFFYFKVFVTCYVISNGEIVMAY